MIEPLVTLLLRDLPASVRLHVYRTLLSDRKVDLDISPWIADLDLPLMLRRDMQTVRYIGSGRYRSGADGLRL